MDGFVSVGEPFDPLPSLAALVSADEIEYADLVLPDAPNKPAAWQYWMRFAEDNQQEIIHSTGNPEYRDFQPSGEQLFHLQFWYRPGAENKIHEQIKHMESLGKVKDQK